MIPDNAIGSISAEAEDFAPEVKDRIITKTTSLSTEVNQGTFNDAQTKLKSIISSTNSYLLNENVNKYGSEKKSYYEASYSIKVDSNKHNELITLLKDIGEVKNFNENTEDITGSYTNIKIELEAEKERLLRYKALYQDSQNIQDKLQLSDKIFDQERRIKYLEDVINSLDKDVEYSTIYLTIREKQSEYVKITLVRFSQLIKNLVNSFNTLLNLIFVLLPYTILFLAIFFIIKLIKRK